MTSGVYLYCIGSRSQLTSERVEQLNVAPADRSDAPIRVIENGDLAALVSDTELCQFDIERDRLMAHHHVLEAAMRLGDILPVSYGIVAECDQDVIDRLLGGSAEQLTANLAHVQGKVELSLRVMWRDGQLFREIVEEVPEVRELRDAIAGISEEASYFERIRLGELASQAIEAKNEAERGHILEHLEPLSADVVVTPSSNESLVLNAAFLVDQEREPAFDAAVQEIGGARQDRMMFRYLGPLPPSSFVSAVIHPGQ